MNLINKIFDRLPYASLAGLKFVHYILMAGGIAALIVGVAWVLAFSPNMEEKAQKEKQLEDANKKLALYLSEGAKKEAITKQVASLYGTLLERKRQMPLATQIPQLLQKVSDIGDFLGVDIVSYSLAPSEDKGFYKSIPISVTIAGNYYKTAGFFDSLQNLLRVVSVNDFNMDLQPGFKVVINDDGDPEKEDIDILHTNIKAKAFAYIEGSEEVTQAPAPKK